MSRNLMLFIFLLLSITQALAYKVSIYTDQPDLLKANEIKELLTQTYPFNKFDMNIEIVAVTSETLKCNSHSKIERLVDCDAKSIRDDSLERSSDQVLIVKDLPTYGGSGGSIPVITSHTPARAMIHEYMHTLGFRDEYCYSATEAAIFCKPEFITPNVIIIKPQESYSGDSDARAKHSSVLPWYSLIKDTTPITNTGGKFLGTGAMEGISTVNNSTEPTPLGSRIGLYRGKTCDNASPPLISWHPGQEETIMKDLNAGIGKANEEVLMNILTAKGISRKISDKPAVMNEVNDAERSQNKSTLPIGNEAPITPKANNQ